MIARVEPLTTARALRGPFDYSLPSRLGDIAVGSVLVVPFGRRRMLGVVVEVAERSDLPPERLVEPLAAVEQGVPPELVRLGLWVGREYCSTPARGLALVLSPGTGTGAHPRLRRRMVLAAALTPAGRDAAGGERTERLGPRQRAALLALQGGPLPAAEVRRRCGCDTTSLRRLERRGLVALADEERLRSRPATVNLGAAGSHSQPMTDPQRLALASVVEAMEDPAGGRFLLHGVTGSGKTEVYLGAAEAALARGRSAIVLVPEIALTTQTVSRFRERFGATVAVLHSRLGARRYDEWLRLRRGEARICVGPRSAVFAPVPDLGLIVIDEEHDASYKQEGDPRYDARAVAEERAARAGAVVLAGSATPRPESRGRLRRLVLAERVDSRPLPPVELVETPASGGPLHARTREALLEVRRRGEKAIVLLNRRGWSNFLSCRGCRRVWGCPRCDVSLVLHRGEGEVRCHHCGHSEAVPRACPDCGSISIARHGAGTERAQQDLELLLDPLPVFRLDADVAAARGAIEDVLVRFDRAPAGVLLGTQMVAKGHDFPAVTLGVVIDADATLRFPDFRAEERTFALVAQLAGRSGRGARGGRVIVQALDPKAPALRHAAGHDSEGFLAAELARREALGYPPFAHLARVVCSSARSAAVEAAAEAVRAAIDASAGSVLGPAPLFRLHGRDRAQVLVKGGDRGAMVRAVRAAVEGAAAEHSRRGVSFAVDIDPQ